jgi:hypothetical protein
MPPVFFAIVLASYCFGFSFLNYKVFMQVAMLQARVNIACGTPSRRAILTIPIFIYLSFSCCV